jgi:hypothetical protein
MGTWDAHNKSVAEELIKKHIQRHVRPGIIRAARKASMLMAQYVTKAFVPAEKRGGNVDFPISLGHMRDSTGMGVYIDGALRSFTPTPAVGTPEEPQRYKERKDIVGVEELKKALTLGATAYNSGIWVVLFSAVPYALQVNTEGSPWGRGQDYFLKLENEAYSLILGALKAELPEITIHL